MERKKRKRKPQQLWPRAHWCWDSGAQNPSGWQQTVKTSEHISGIKRPPLPLLIGLCLFAF